ncbi:MAG: DNA-binding winged helix-turn-helix (wHTH) protein/Tfp pilus assembly protein PilF [Glaciecola sp.]|jgi:DNA-binding winged helix-turn-helix (wHTH) protein/Tfp pilus assembly protein PilF
MRQIEVHDLVVELDEYKVSRNGEVINLPKLSFELFIYLIENAQKICSIEQISLAVWKDIVVSNETVIQRITLLRKALNDDPKKPTYIESVRARGYRFLLLPSQQIHAQNNNWIKNKKLLVASACALVLISTGIVLSADTFVKWASAPPQTEITNTSFQSAGTNANVGSLLSRGDYYYNIGQKENIDRAAELYREALMIDPASEGALIGLSFALSKSVCRYNQAITNAQEANKLAKLAMAINDGSRVRGALAYSWDCIGNIEFALEHYVKSIELDAKNYKSIGSAAHLLETKGSLLEAYKWSKRAKQLQSNNHMADLQIARILELLKFTSQAHSSYQKLFILFPDNVFINDALPRFLYFQGRFSEAKEVIEKVLKRDIERGEILLYYAELVWLLEGKKKALPWFSEAAKINATPSYAKTIQLLINDQMSIADATIKINNIEDLVQQGDTWPANYVESALIAIWAIDSHQQAITLLKKAVNLGYLNSEYLTISPLFSQLRKHPEFYQLIDDINQRRESMNAKFLAAYPPLDIEYAPTSSGYPSAHN